MKTFIAILAMYIVLAVLACQDSQQDGGNPYSENEYYKAVGKQIPFETGMRWLDFYKTTNKAGRNNLVANYWISASQTQSMLQSVSGVIGVAFHYGLDALGEKHIIVVPIDGTLHLWTLIPGRIYLDANTGNPISQTTAQTWAQNYKNLNPTGIWFHFFGKNIFDEIQAIPFFTSIDIEPAMDDLNLTPQLLLIIWNEQLLTGGRTTSEEAMVYDASNPCPPCNME